MKNIKNAVNDALQQETSTGTRNNINIFKRVILPFKVFFALVVSYILTIITWGLLWLMAYTFPVIIPDLTHWVGQTIVASIMLSTGLVYLYTTFKWLFYNTQYRYWAWI